MPDVREILIKYHIFIGYQKSIREMGTKEVPHLNWLLNKYEVLIELDLYSVPYSIFIGIDVGLNSGNILVTDP